MHAHIFRCRFFKMSHVLSPKGPHVSPATKHELISSWANEGEATINAGT